MNPLPMTARCCILVVLLSQTAYAESAPRFQGAAYLSYSADASGDGRYTLQARLDRAEDGGPEGRFQLRTTFGADVPAKSAVLACGGLSDPIFSNGFEPEVIP